MELLTVLTACLLVTAVLAQKNIRKGEYNDYAAAYIIDTDAGVDDAIAILLMLGAEKAHGNIRTVAVTCVNGNTRVDNVVVNVLKTLKTAGRLDIPVYKGANESIMSNDKYDDYFGVDGFGDFDYPDPPSPSLVRRNHSVNAMINIVRRNPGQISIICLGPLTNVALAIRMYPHFLRIVKDVFVLGGSVEGYGNIRPGVEFNFHVDPESALIVFERAERDKKEIIVVPWEAVILRGLIPMEWRVNVFGGLKSSAVNLINKAEKKSLSPRASFWYQGDPMLAAIAVNGSLVKNSTRVPVSVETCGKSARGAVFLDYANEEWKSPVKIVREIHMDDYKKMLLKYMSD